MNTGAKAGHLTKAQEAYKKAVSAAKGGLLTKPDPDKAAFEFGEAAKAYKLAGPEYISQQVDMLIRSAEQHQKAGSNHSAGRQYEEAVKAMEGRKGDEEKCAEILASTAPLYRANEHPDRAAQNLVKAAKIIGDKDPNKAVEYFRQAVEVVEMDDRGKFSNDMMKNMIGYLVKREKFVEAIEMIRKQNGIYLKTGGFQHYYSQNALALLVLLMHVEQYDQVEHEYKELQEKNQLAEDYREVCEELIDALRMADNSALQACTKKQIFTFLDNEVAKLARTLAVDEEKLKAMWEKADPLKNLEEEEVDLK